MENISGIEVNNYGDFIDPVMGTEITEKDFRNAFREDFGINFRFFVLIQETFKICSDSISASDSDRFINTTYLLRRVKNSLLYLQSLDSNERSKSFYGISMPDNSICEDVISELNDCKDALKKIESKQNESKYIILSENEFFDPVSGKILDNDECIQRFLSTPQKVKDLCLYLERLFVQLAPFLEVNTLDRSFNYQNVMEKVKTAIMMLEGIDPNERLAIKFLNEGVVYIPAFEALRILKECAKNANIEIAQHDTENYLKDSIAESGIEGIVGMIQLNLSMNGFNAEVRSEGSEIITNALDEELISDYENLNDIAENPYLYPANEVEMAKQSLQIMKTQNFSFTQSPEDRELFKNAGVKKCSFYIGGKFISSEYIK